MNARQLRTLRGTGAAAVAAWTAAVSHTVAGGAAPSAGLVLVVILLAAPLAVALAGRRLGILRLSLTVIATQLLLHVAFAVTAGLDPTAGAHLHGAHAETLGPLTAVAPGPLMTAAHLIAASVTMLVLCHGERMLRAIARGLVRILRPAVLALAPLVARPSTAPTRDVARPVARTRASDVSRRGPPLVVVAA